MTIRSIERGIRKKQRIKKGYAIMIAMKPFAEHRQRSLPQSFPVDLSGSCEQGFISDNCDSEEDDMHLFDDIPREPTLALNTNHKFSGIKDELAVSILKTFVSETWTRSSRLQTEIRVCPQTEDLPKIYHRTDADIKRTTHETIPDAQLHESSIRVERYFACPFYVKKPERYMGCFTRANLRDIKDVKQHLWNIHQLPPNCPSCGEIFATVASCDDHIRSQSCTIREVTRPEGITMEQMQQLARRADPWIPEALEWLSLWAIVFPGASLPATTYPSTFLESAVCLFRDYWSGYGETIISNFLEEKGLRDYKHQDEERSLAALYMAVLHQVIDRLVETFKDGDGMTVSQKIEQLLSLSQHL